MPGEAVKLIRVPIDTNCGDCKKELSFGSWAYYSSVEMVAVCPECGVKRGWTPKDRVNQLIALLELREDVKALKQQRKIETDALFLLKQKIELHRLGERDLELEQQIVKLNNLVQDYLRSCGNADEKAALQKIFDAIRENQDIQREVREQIDRFLFRKRRKSPIIEEEQETAA